MKIRKITLGKRVRNKYFNMYLWLSIYGIFVSSIFLIKSLNAYMHHDSSSFFNHIANAEAAIIAPKPSLTPTPTIAPEAITKKEYILSKSHGDILLRIWTNESSRGNSDGLAGYCSAKGQSNEFGYYPQVKYCFSSFDYSVDRVNAWFESCLQDSSLEECLLKYSGNSPTYVSDFMSQSNK